MTSHIRVNIDGYDLVLPENTSIDIEDRNPYLNDGIDTFSYGFEVSIADNRELLGAIDYIHDDSRLLQLEGKPMEIYVDGLLFRSGKVATIEEQELKGTITLSMTSARKQLSDLVGDLSLQDLTFPAEDAASLQIGEMIGDIQVDASSQSDYTVRPRFSFEKKPNPNGYYRFQWTYDIETHNTPSDAQMIQPQALGFSSNKEYKCSPTSPYTPAKNNDDELIADKDFINTAAAFDEQIIQPDGTTRRALYHNARISYYHHRKEEDKDGNITSSDDVLISPNGYGPYYVLEADRPQSGVCFYLMYVLEALFKYLGVAYDDTALRRIEDMRHLSFFTTKCKYDLVRKDGQPSGSAPNFAFSSDFDQNGINQWLTDRKCGGKLTPGNERSDESETKIACAVYPRLYVYPYPLDPSTILSERDNLTFVCDFKYDGISFYVRKDEAVTRSVLVDEYFEMECIDKTANGAGRNFAGPWRATLQSIDVSSPNADFRYGASVMKMIANAQNLPDMKVTDFLESLWASFGIKFEYDSERNLVTAYLVRDVLRSREKPMPIAGDVYEVVKETERITGVRMKYSAENDRSTQLANVRKLMTDYDTTFDYLVEKSPFLVTNRRLRDIQRGTLSVGDYNCYVDPMTGNAYRIKISKDALKDSKLSALKPATFEVASGKGITEYAPEYAGMTETEQQESDVEDGIVELSSSFVPLIQNDLLAGRSVSDTAMLCPFTDSEMWNEEVPMSAIRNVVESTLSIYYYIDEMVETDERYDVDSSDDGNSPLQSVDWGNCITLMRGGGADARIQYFDYDYDGHGSAKWRMLSGQYMMDSDSITPYGAYYDYNGTLPGLGGEGGDVPPSPVYDKAWAEQQMKYLWPDSNADLKAATRKVAAADAAAMGYDVTGRENLAYLATSGRMEVSGVAHNIIYARITDTGEILSPSDALAYFETIAQEAAATGQTPMAIDAQRRRLFIVDYDDSFAVAIDSDLLILEDFEMYYFADVFFPINPIDRQRISLKIRAYHTDANGNILCDQNNAYRGLADAFMAEFIRLLLYRKKLVIRMMCEMQYLIDLPWKHRVQIGELSGWLDGISTRVSAAKGVEKVEPILLTI